MNVNISVVNKERTLKSKIIFKKMKRILSKLPSNLKELLSEGNVSFYINKIDFKYKILGSFGLEEKPNNKFVTNIVISPKCSFSRLEETLYHEIGHFIDCYIGCKYNNKDIQIDNMMNYKFSITNPYFNILGKQYNSDIFNSQLEIEKNEDIVKELAEIQKKYYLTEYFADLFAFKFKKSKNLFFLTDNCDIEKELNNYLFKNNRRRF